MEIESEAELWALLIAILELKFGPDTRCSYELAGSKPLSAVANRCWEAFADTRLYSVTQPQVGWPSWRSLTPDSDVWPILRERVERCVQGTAWNGWSADERRNYVKILAAPFTIDNAIIDSEFPVTSG